MFDSLSERLGRTVKQLRGQGRLSEDNIKDTMREVRMALLEADVALPVVKNFVDSVREKALGQEVLGSLSPGQALIKVVNDELIEVMGAHASQLNLATEPPAVAFSVLSPLSSANVFLPVSYTHLTLPTTPYV